MFFCTIGNHNAIKDFGPQKISSFLGPKCIIRQLRKVLRKADVVCYHPPPFRQLLARIFLFLNKIFGRSLLTVVDPNDCKWFFACLGFPGVSEGKESAYNAGDAGLIHGSGKSPGEGNGNPL